MVANDTVGGGWLVQSPTFRLSENSWVAGEQPEFANDISKWTMANYPNLLRTIQELVDPYQVYIYRFRQLLLKVEKASYLYSGFSSRGSTALLGLQYNNAGQEIVVKQCYH